MTKQEAKEAIDKLIQEAYDKVSEAESIADEHQLTFDFEVAYAMGGTYYGANNKDEEEWLEDYDISKGEGGWIASSQQC